MSLSFDENVKNYRTNNTIQKYTCYANVQYYYCHWVDDTDLSLKLLSFFLLFSKSPLSLLLGFILFQKFPKFIQQRLGPVIEFCRFDTPYYGNVKAFP